MQVTATIPILKEIEYIRYYFYGKINYYLILSDVRNML